MTVAALVMGAVPVAMPASASGTFVDDDGSGHEAAIERLAAAGITKGCNPPDNDAFCPEQPVTRGQMAAFFARALSLTGPGHTFADTGGHIFEYEIGRLASAGITRGCDPPQDTRFCPDEAVTRGQMAAFLNRALDLAPANVAFEDADGHVFESDIGAIAAAALTRGCNPPANSLFCPDRLITRAEMATFLVRAGLTDEGATATPTTQVLQPPTTPSTTPTTTGPTTSTSTTTTTISTSTTTTPGPTVPGTPPSMDRIDNQWARLHTQVDLGISAHDVDGESLSFAVSGPDGFVSLTDHGDGTAVLHLTPLSLGVFPIIVRVTDSTDLVTSRGFMLTVQDYDPEADGAWVEANGLVLIEAEHGELSEGWVTSPEPGSLGDGAINWFGPVPPNEGDVAAYRLVIGRRDFFELMIRTTTWSPPADVRVRIVDRTPWLSFTERRANEWTWWQGTSGSETTLVLDPGSYVIEISGLSPELYIDRIALRNNEVADFPADHFPESYRLP